MRAKAGIFVGLGRGGGDDVCKVEVCRVWWGCVQAGRVAVDGRGGRESCDQQQAGGVAYLSRQPARPISNSASVTPGALAASWNAASERNAATAP